MTTDAPTPRRTQTRERLWDAAGAGAKVNEAALKAMAEQASR